MNQHAQVKLHRRSLRLDAHDYTVLSVRPSDDVRFDADPSNPIVVVNADLGRPSRQALAQLNARLPFRTKPEGTVKLATFGIEPFLSGDRNLH